MLERRIENSLWFIVQHSSFLIGGEGGIRTHGTLAGSTVFETARFNHSRTSPHDSRLTSFEKKGL